jgi:ribosome-associated toxin RatA of RatAB toxin-antitoxin module
MMSETVIDAEALRALQAPLKAKYREDQNAAIITLRARGEIDEAKIACKLETGRAIAEAGLHPLTGGSGAELCSGDMLLEALVACAGVTLKAVSTALNIPLRAGHVIAEGDLDFRGTLGVDKEAPVGFKAIRESFTSRVTKDRPREIAVHYVDGPLSDLDNVWTFRAVDDQTCEIDFLVEFTFRNRLFERIAGQYFDRAFSKMVEAFEARAAELYGSSNSSAQSVA